MSSSIYEHSLDYHKYPKPGKLEITPTKPLADQQDLALAYSPGVAAASKLIADQPEEVPYLTARGNLIAVVSNGTAVLGLGNVGPLASKPVMEGKAVLFKKFAGIDAFDIEIKEEDPQKLVDIICALEPTFGGINLEDIKAPECFYVERELRKRLNIPVFHDDQHGTAIIVAAAILNGLKLVQKNLSNVRLVTSGAGAAAIACLDLLVSLGLEPNHITVCDSKGVIFKGRSGQPLDEFKAKYASNTSYRTLEEALKDADIFLGLSIANVLTQDMVKSMAAYPLILALANPEPEILPDLVKEVRSDAIIATGRSDYPNQVNNVLCFPYIFRGALDVGATTINQEMKIACVKALAELAQAECSDIVTTAYGGVVHFFGPDYIIPKPFDPRLFVELASVVAQAAMDSGVATRPIEDMQAYRQKLTDFVYRSSMVMRPVIQRAKENPKRLAFSEGEDERVLQAAQILVDEQIAKPILIGRPDVIERRLKKLGLRLKADQDITLIDPNNDNRYGLYWRAYHRCMERRGISPDAAKTLVRTNTTIIGALTVHLGDADSLICGTIGRYHIHLNHVVQILGLSPVHQITASLACLILDQGVLFIVDPYVNEDPSATEICDITLLAAEQVKRFGLQPKIALLSHSNFGTSQHPSAKKMRQALNLILDRVPELEIEGEMHVDSALSAEIRKRIFPNSRLQGSANLLIMPTLDAANIAYNLAKSVGNGLPIGPILLGLDKSAHILTASTTVRGIVNMAAFAVVDAQEITLYT
ncbi:MAG: NADP-dependent malic enzyme [Proteobacteria bacterium]|nr:NADP-dependent malic enzyme [Pseudomonadota bacterium]